MWSLNVKMILLFLFHSLNSLVMNFTKNSVIQCEIESKEYEEKKHQ